MNAGDWGAMKDQGDTITQSLVWPRPGGSCGLPKATVPTIQTGGSEFLLWIGEICWRGKWANLLNGKGRVADKD